MVALLAFCMSVNDTLEVSLLLEVEHKMAHSHSLILQARRGKPDRPEAYWAACCDFHTLELSNCRD